MRCHYCGGESRVVDSRPLQDGIRRRRQCISCGKRFTTHERLAALELKVAKARGRPPEEFQAAKIAATIKRVCKGLEVPPGCAEQIARKIERELADKNVAMIRTAEIAAILMNELGAVSEAALERFAINYALDGDAAQRRPASSMEQQIPLFGEE